MLTCLIIGPQSSANTYSRQISVKVASTKTRRRAHQRQAAGEAATEIATGEGLGFRPLLLRSELISKDCW